MTLKNTLVNRFCNILDIDEYKLLEQKDIKNTNKDVIKINHSNELLYDFLTLYIKKTYIAIYNYNKTSLDIPLGLILEYGLEDKAGLYRMLKDAYVYIIVKKDTKETYHFKIKNEFFDEHLLTYEYNLELIKKDYKKTYIKGINKLPFKVLYTFWFDKTKVRDFLKVLFSNMLFAFGIASVFVSILLYFNSQQIQNEYDINKNTYKKLSYETKKLKSSLYIYNNEYEKSKIQINSIIGVNKAVLFDNISQKISTLDDTYLKYFKINDHHLELAIDTKNSTSILEKLNSIKEIKNISILSTYALRKSKLKRIRFKADIIYAK